MKIFIAISGLIWISYVSCDNFLFGRSDFIDFQRLDEIYLKPRVLDRNKATKDFQVEQLLRRTLKKQRGVDTLLIDPADIPLLGFTWSNCGSSSDPVKISGLSVSPDPIDLPGNVTVSGRVTVTETIGSSPVQVSLEVKKKILFWITIPCVDHIGSCTYDNVCDLDPYKSKECPPVFTKNKIPCKCPIAKGSYNVPPTTISVKLPPSVPSWLSDGDYQVKATLSSAGKQLLCIQTAFSITK